MDSGKLLERRALLRNLGLAAGVTFTIGALRSAGAEEETKEEDKINQKEAQYQNHPKGQQRCEICLNFQPPNKCRIVQGPINPKGWCQYFAARENAR